VEGDDQTRRSLAGIRRALWKPSTVLTPAPRPFTAPAPCRAPPRVVGDQETKTSDRDPYADLRKHSPNLRGLKTRWWQSARRPCRVAFIVHEIMGTFHQIG